MMLLSALLGEPRPGQPFVLLQSTAAQSIFPLLRILCQRSSVYSLVYTFLYAPNSLVEQDSSNVEVYDWTGEVPGYSSSPNFKTHLLSAIQGTPRDKPLSVVVDSLETLAENLASPTETYELLHEILQLIKNRPNPSQLIVHSVKPSEIAILLLQTQFSSSLAHLIAHPTSLFVHLAKEYMISPPPITDDIKFWNLFIPFSERTHEVERLSFGPSGEGSCTTDEIVVEILTRGASGQPRKRGTERTLEGWESTKGMPSAVTDLQGLKPLFSQKSAAKSAPDPTQNLPFNLSLSQSQQQSRAQVPLPYVHEGQRPDATASNAGAIFYDPDSADDLDDDDPDEDLDI